MLKIKKCRNGFENELRRSTDIGYKQHDGYRKFSERIFRTVYPFT